MLTLLPNNGQSEYCIYVQIFARTIFCECESFVSGRVGRVLLPCYVRRCHVSYKPSLQYHPSYSNREHRMILLIYPQSLAMHCILCPASDWTEMFPYDFRDERMMRSLKEMTQTCIGLNAVSIIHTVPRYCCYVYTIVLAVLLHFFPSPLHPPPPSPSTGLPWVCWTVTVYAGQEAKHFGQVRTCSCTG